MTVLVRPAGAQTWNDPRSRSIVEGATQRRAEQLADTALRDYQAVAHGYVAFLAQLGEGFRTPPKVIKTDELEDEVYWKAPNLSKQRIVGRRDTLLLPTDIAYHTDHLGIVTNNFPDIIRIGDGGDEVRDVPHPLSRVGLTQYDFALADSFSIGQGAQRIHVYEVKVRPRNDQLPRVVGAVYIDPSSNQVVRMNLTFTRAAFLDPALEDLSLVLENRLVGGRFWLPSRQEIEIRRKGEWLEYPARGIIRGRWEIGDYRFNQDVAPALFVGPEIVIAPPQVLAQHKWQGRILDSLPPDVRAISEPDIQRVQEEARALVRAQALATAKRATLSGRKISDFGRFDRVEGLALGGGLQQQFGGGMQATARARYGIDDKQTKGAAEISWLWADGSAVRLFGSRDFRDVGDFEERSSVVNSLAAQEFGSDYTDPYLARAAGLRIDLPTFRDFDFHFNGSYEWQSPLEIHATPVTGTFGPTIQFRDIHTARLALDAQRPTSLWVGGTELTVRGQLRAQFPGGNPPVNAPGLYARTYRAFAAVNVERPIGEQLRIATAFSAAGVGRFADEFRRLPPTEVVYLGGPVSAPGFDYHSIVGTSGFTGHAELRMPAPFPAFSLGRYGRVPNRGTFAPYVHAAAIGDVPSQCVTLDAGAATCPSDQRFFPAVGVAYLLPFDIVRFDVAKGFGTTGRWTFYVDVAREFWSIL